MTLQKKTWLVALLLLCVLVVHAANNREILPVIVAPLNASNVLSPNTAFNYNFVFANTQSCVSLLNISTTITTDAKGIGYAELNISTLSIVPNYVCEYVSNTLRKTHPVFSSTFEDFKTNPLGYYNSSTIPSYLSSETDPLWSGNKSLYYLVSNPLGYYNISTLPTSTSTGWTQAGSTTSTNDTVRINGSATPTIQMNDTVDNKQWTIVVGTSGDQFIVQAPSGSNICYLSNNAGTVTCQNAIFVSSYSGATALSVQGVSGMTVNYAEVKNGSQTFFSVNGTGDVLVNSTLRVNGIKVCLSDGTNCPSAGETLWQGNSTLVYYATNPLGFINISGEKDQLWTGNQSLYYLKSNPFSFYNVSTIPAYLLSETDPLWSGNQSLYYLKSNPFSFYNASTVPAYLLVETDPLWSGNQSLYYLKSNPFSYYNTSTIPSYGSGTSNLTHSDVANVEGNFSKANSTLCQSNGANCPAGTQTVFNATSSFNVTGQLFYALSNTSIPDGQTQDSLESLTAGTDYRLNFTGVTGFDYIDMREWYNGTIANSLTLSLWNYNTTAWDTIETFMLQTKFITSSNFVLQNAYINGTTVQARITGSAVGADRFLLDYLVLRLNSGANSATVDGSGITNALTLWLDPTSLGSSIISQSGNVTSVAGNLTANTITANILSSSVNFTTDIITQGSSNKYQNQTFNETRTNALYYLLTNPWGYYNSSSIPAYALSASVPTGSGFVNGTTQVRLIDNSTNVSIGNISGNPTLFIDNANGRVGIGKNTPLNALEVIGTINATAMKVGTTNVCLSDGTNCQAATASVRNITWTNGYYQNVMFGGLGGVSITNLNSTVLCNPFPVQAGDQAAFTNITTWVRTANASTYMNFAIYNCTATGDKMHCASGTLLINTSFFSLSSVGMNGPFNTTGNWTLPAGNYVACAGTNTTNTVSNVLQGLVNNAGQDFVLQASVNGGGFPTSLSFTVATANRPAIWMYRQDGVMP